MYGKLLKVFFVLNFLFSSISAQNGVYDNSIVTATSDQNTSACIFTETEHFVVEKTDTSARMHLTTAKKFQTILANLQFCLKYNQIQLQKKMEVGLQKTLSVMCLGSHNF
jgi:hypothetical protein